MVRTWIRIGLVVASVVGNLVFAYEDGRAVFLRDNWYMRSAFLVKEDGQTLTEGKFQPCDFYRTNIPTTVLTALVANGVYPDPYVGMNNMKIPDASEEFSRKYGLNRFSYLPDNRNPWVDPYWFWTQFRLPEAFKGKSIGLNIEGINYRADVWLNGHLVADSKEVVGMFGRWALEITKLIHVEGDNALAIKIYPLDHPGLPGQPQLEAFGPFGLNGGPTGDIGKNVTMQCSVGWDWTPAVRDRNMGIWQDIALTATGPVDISYPHVITHLPLPEVDKALMSVSAEAVNLSESEIEGVAILKIHPSSSEKSMIVLEKMVELAAGEKHRLHFHSDEYPELMLERPKLWWPNGYGPQNLYRMEITFKLDNDISDFEECTFGIREVSSEVTEVGEWNRRDFFVNGKKILLRGGAWVPDMMLNRDTKKLLHELRLSKEAYLNMVRIWGGGVTPPEEFFRICDELGLLVWHDFWITGDCQGTWDKGSQDYPIETDVFLKNAVAVVKRLRNHPSLLVWTAGNEGHPRKEIYVPLRDEIVAKLDGNRPFLPSSGYTEPPENWGLSWPDNQKAGSYSGGPYSWIDPREYFQKVKAGKDWLFKNEVGLPSVPHWESLGKFIPDLTPDPDVKFPLNHTWGYHDACEGNGKYSLYDRAIRERYGEPADLKDYAQKAQLVNAESYRAIFEAVNQNIGQTAGVLLWKTNPAWPSVIWQLYDWHLRPHAGYYFAKRANEPLHIQLDLDDRSVTVVNHFSAPKKPLLAVAHLYSLDMEEIWAEKADVEIDAHSSSAVFKVEFPEDVPESVCLLDLRLNNAEGISVSHNLYWLASNDDFSALEKLPTVDLDVNIAVLEMGKLRIHKIHFFNDSDSIAFFVNPSIRKGKEGPEILPSFWSDNYISLLPGETKDLIVEFEDEQLEGATPYLGVDGWNIRSKLVKID
ncbi:MAG: glycoside hydrolase family 2 TIM barrel-domain containing protein [Candidatus Aminicenantes bacterium]|jgi:exo-1,4-beta-D-glucosaminidase